MQPKQFTVYIYLLTLRLVFVDTLRYVSLYKTQRQVNISIYNRNHFILRIQVLSQTLRQVADNTLQSVLTLGMYSKLILMARFVIKIEIAFNFL